MAGPRRRAILGAVRPRPVARDEAFGRLGDRADGPQPAGPAGQRTAFAALFAYGLTLEELPPDVNGLAAAIVNAEAFAAEVAELIRSLSIRSAA
jgi:hypothetical protein